MKRVCDTNRRIHEKTEILEAYQRRAISGARILNSVMIESSDYDIAGVVQFTLDKGKTCRFVFIKADGAMRGGSHAWPIDGEPSLSAAGKDCVSCRLLRKDGSVYTARITYSEDELTGESYFTHTF